MLVKGIRCKHCGDIIYSRAQHDFRWCSCCGCAIDGGFDYVKIIGTPSTYEVMTIDILESKDDEEVKKILFDDWNRGKDKYGIIKGKHILCE